MNLQRILDTLQELSSDADYQAALWAGKIEGEQTSFIEAVCALFDDAGLARGIDSGALDRNCSTSLCRLARQLRSLVKLIDHKGSPEQILNHPKMNAIRETAHELSKLFVAESLPPSPDS
jgi:hypothetical protein